MGSSAMARKARPLRVLYNMKNTPETATTPTARAATCPVIRLIRPMRKRGSPPDMEGGKAMGRPLLNPWESTSVMIMPMPKDKTMVVLISTSSRFFMILENSGAETMFKNTDEATAAKRASNILFPLHCNTSQAVYMEKITTWG